MSVSLDELHAEELFSVLVEELSLVLFGEVEEILASPVSELMSRLANLFYFIGNNSINELAANLLAPVNTLIAEVDPIFPLAIQIDVGQVGIEGAEIIKLFLGKVIVKV